MLSVVRRQSVYAVYLLFAGSSEALLSGQKPPFRLLVRAMNASDNSRATDFKFLVSEAFVVWLVPLVCPLT